MKERGKSKINKFKRILAIIIMMAGVLSMTYPFVSFKIEALRYGERIRGFEDYVDSMSESQREEIMRDAEKYKNQQAKDGSSIVDPFMMEGASEISALGENVKGPFGYIVIPKLDVKNPIYLGASEGNLMRGVAQVSGTDLPVGGESTRSVIAGHRGNHRVSMMFRYLDRLKENDKVCIYTPNKRLTYAVRNMEVIYPTQNERLLEIKGRDMLTLLTCHPFPVEDKRLLVNCERVSDDDGYSAGLSISDSINRDMKSTGPDYEVKRANIINLLMLSIFIVAMPILIFLLIREIRGPGNSRI